MATNKEAVRKVVEEGYSQGKLEALDEYCAEGYVMHEAFGGDLDIAGEKQLIQMYRNAFPDLHVEINELIEEGNFVCARWTATGTSEGELLGISPNGKTSSNEGLLMVRIEDGKAVESWQVFNTLGFVQELREGAGAEQQPTQEGGPEASPI